MSEKVTIHCSICGNPRQVSIHSITKGYKHSNNCASCAAKLREKTLANGRKSRFSPMRIGDCILYPKRESRCDKVETCERASRCLTATSLPDWPGWEAEYAPVKEPVSEEVLEAV